MITYVNKGLSLVQKRFHPMEGECYALIWGIMHFCQFLCHNHLTLKIDHKSLEWLAIVFDAYGQRGRWIDMLQDFNFKILHRSRFKHMNANVFNKNVVNKAKEDENSPKKSKKLDYCGKWVYGHGVEGEVFIIPPHLPYSWLKPMK